MQYAHRSLCFFSSSLCSASGIYVSAVVSDEHPDHDLAMVLEKAFREKCSAEDMIDLLRKKTEGHADPNFTLSIFLKVLLFLARKTFSHNFAALTRQVSFRANFIPVFLYMKTLSSLWNGFSVFASKCLWCGRYQSR